MDDRTQGALLLAVGGVALRLGLTDAALAYVKPGLQPLLTISGLVLVLLGAVAVRRAFREPAGEPARAAGGDLDHAHVDAAGRAEVVDDGHGHGANGPAVAWLLVLPLLALLLIAPPPLGAFAANRQSQAPAVDTAVTYPPLPEPVGGAVELSFTEFTFRALYDEERSLEDATVRVTGFVSATDAPEGYTLSRFTLSCCAADGRATSIVAAGDPQPAPAVDAWVTLEGTWEPRPAVDGRQPFDQPPLLRVTSRQEVNAPSQPYEY